MKIAWISYFPIEWLPEVPEPLRGLPKQHPATWQRVLLEELEGVPELTIHVLVVRRQFARSLSFESNGVSFHCLKLPRGMRALSLFWWETILIRRSLLRLQPDLVHAWGAERGAALVASRLGYPYLVTMQGLLQWYLENVELGWTARFEAFLERMSLRRASVATVESRFGVNWLQQRHHQLEVHQVEHAPSRQFYEVQRLPEAKPPRFLFVGRMSIIKGTDLLLRALDKLVLELDFRLTMAGSAPPAFLKKMKDVTSGALWERITILKDLSPAQVADELRRATIVLFPTRVDNSPNSVKEAVVAGVPVVASATGGIVDYIVPDRNGLTFPPGDLEAFTQAVRRAISHPLFGQGRVDPQTLSQMRDYLSPRVMAERFLGAYRRVLEKAQGAAKT